ncbi:MAG: glycosyltransferase, partial [Dokdonella sp.]
FEVRHQCGSRDIDEVQRAYADIGVKASVVSFIEDMADSYGWADLAVCRAGALTVAELSAAGLGAVLVPFPLAVDDHQTRNAKILVDIGAASIISDVELAPETLAVRIQQASASRDALIAMATAARSLARPGAVERIVECCLEPAS